MRTINARRIETYSRCPKKAQYQWNIVPEMPQVQSVISNVVKMAYLFQIRKGHFPPFRRFSKWTDQFLEQQLIETGDYKHNKELLTILSHWYNKLYLEKYYDDGVINLPVSMNLGSQLIYHDTIDLVTLGNTTQLFDFAEVRDNKDFRAYNGTRIYNDLVAQSHIWSFWKASGLMPDYYVRLVIGPRSMRDVRIKITKKTLQKIEGYVRQITRGMQDHAFYPSFSSQCTSCAFVAQCSM